ncbi:MAG: PqqD family peptide modification chaperone [Bacteroidales bacterium]|nr:PqqD family peptide modification chaperone [Bacteroidales bacterium]
MNNLKVLQLGKFLPGGGGIETVVYDIARGLAQRGIRCDVMVTVEGAADYVRPYCHNCDIIACHAVATAASTMISTSMIATLHRICHNYDIIHVHHPNPMATLALLLSGYRGRVVLHWHSDIIRQRVALAFFAPLQRWLINRADLILGTSERYINGSPWLRGSRQKTKALPIGIKQMAHDELGASRLRQRYGHRKIIFSLGRLIYYKGYKYLIDAAALLPDDYVVLIGGGGPLQGELQAQIDRLGLNGKVVLLGRVPDSDLPSYYTACTLYCMSSCQKSEAFGVVLLEAMSVGRPIVATDIPHSGVSFVNAHGVTGLNVEPENPQALAQAITTICRDPEMHARFSQATRERFLGMFTVDKMIDGCCRHYEEVLAADEAWATAEPLPPLVMSRGNRHLSLRQIGSDHVMVEIADGNVNMTRVYTFNETAAWIWQHMAAEGPDLLRLTSSMCEVFAVEPEEASRDIELQIQQWTQLGIMPTLS